MNADSPFPLIYLARHGETDWTITGQHTGLTDLPLTEHGEQNARRHGPRLQAVSFAKVLTSPLTRAARTCELAGYGSVAEPDRDLVEWSYGQYEGMTTAAIRENLSGWNIFRDGCPGGETLAGVVARVTRVIGRIRTVDGNVMLFSHSHFLHVFAACWLGLPPIAGRHFFLDTGAVSVVGYHHGLDEPVIRLWNDCSYQES